MRSRAATAVNHADQCHNTLTGGGRICAIFVADVVDERAQIGITERHAGECNRRIAAHDGHAITADATDRAADSVGQRYIRTADDQIFGQVGDIADGEDGTGKGLAAVIGGHADAAEEINATAAALGKGGVGTGGSEGRNGIRTGHGNFIGFGGCVVTVHAAAVEVVVAVESRPVHSLGPNDRMDRPLDHGSIHLVYSSRKHNQS